MNPRDTRIPGALPQVEPLDRAGVAHTAQLLLRYRPSADVLLGVITHAGEPDHDATAPADDLLEQPDADTAVVWHRPVSGPFAGRALLQSFEIVHARARWDADELFVLPRAVAAACFSAISEGTAHHARIESPTEQLRYRTEQHLEFPLRSLLRREIAPAGHASHVAGTHRDALAVARSLEALALQLRRSTGGTHNPRNSPDDHLVAHQRVVRFCALAEELGAVLADAEHPLPAPGTSAALRTQLRGGLPLSGSERSALRTALTDVDTPRLWSHVADEVQRIASAVAAHSTPRGSSPDA